MNDNTNAYTPDLIRHYLDKVIFHYSHNYIGYCLDPVSNFTRNRKMNLETLIRFIINKQNKAIKSELCDFFTDSTSFPTDSAFCQQRAKLDSSIFRDMMISLNKCLPFASAFKGYHVLADDGSDIYIPFDPNDQDTLCCYSDTNRPYSQFHLNALLDCLTGVFLDASIDLPGKKRESGALMQFIGNRNYPEKSIITADRGYEGYNLIACMVENNQKYLIRIKDVNKGGILYNTQLPKNDEFDIDIKKILTRKQTKLIKDSKGVFTFMPSNVKFDYLPIEEDFYEMDIRIIRIKIGEGEYECLATNLDRDSFTMDDIKELYHLRWEIETNFRTLKYTIGMLSFSSRKRNNIKQEIYASMILHNISRMIVASIEIEQKSKNKYKAKINFSAALTNIRQYLKGKIDGNVLICKIKRFLVPVRPERSFKRNMRPRSTKSLNHKAS